MWSECIAIYCINPYRLAICCINLCCLHGLHVLLVWPECITIYCVNSYCLRHQYVSPCGTHIASMCHCVALTSSVCVTVWCPHSQSVLVSQFASSAYITTCCPRCQSVSRYVVSLHVAHMVSMICHHILPTVAGCYHVFKWSHRILLVIEMSTFSWLLYTVLYDGYHVCSHMGHCDRIISIDTARWSTHWIPLGQVFHHIYHALVRFNRCHMVSVSSVRQAVHLSTHRLNGTSAMAQYDHEPHNWCVI
jgi:hypothetical protein